MSELVDNALDFDALLELPPEKTLILTVNNRLSRSMTSSYVRKRQTRSTALPAILPWSAWLAQSAFELSFDQPLPQDPVHVLDPAVARLIWREVIAARDEQDGVRGLIDVEQLALLAGQADELVLHWQIAVDPSWTTPEYEQFVQWKQAYEDRLAQLNAIDRARLTLHMRDWVSQGRVALPENVVLAGFTQRSRAMADVVQAIRERGAIVHDLIVQDREQVHPVRKIRSATSSEQWRQAIEWARQSLERNPDQRFAIVVPDLQASADHVRRLLHTVLGSTHAFNVAVAPPLMQWPPVRAMLAWLRLTGHLKTNADAPIEMAGQALLAGLCAGDVAERGSRAMIDARWRQRGLLNVPLDEWLRMLEGLPELGPAWSAMFDLWQPVQAQTRQRWDQWVNLFRQSLSVLGFPGEQTRTSTGYQAVQALDGLLAKAAGFDDFFAQVTWSQALARLESLARQTPFQPQRDRSARLDVLGLLESEGGHWDGVWIMGLTDAVLPAAISPNPLLPRAALNQAQAPRSTPQREREWAGRMFESLCKLAPNVIMSWPARDEQQALRPSPFLAQIDSTDQNDTSDSGLEAGHGSAGSIAVQTWVDGPCPPLNADELIHGGVSVLDTQSKNPMWAFVRYRLHTRGLDPYARVPSRAQRGEFLHAVMLAVWERLRTRSGLVQQFGTAEFVRWLQSTAANLAKLTLPDWPHALVALEQVRAIDLVTQWLEKEMQRTDFEVVEKESAHHLKFGLLEIKVVIDRLDKIVGDADTGAKQHPGEGAGLSCSDSEPTRWALLDYKTGMSRPSPWRDWDRERPVDVQMLAYVRAIKLAKGESPVTVSWAQLHPRKLGFGGVSLEGFSLPGFDNKSSLPEEQWQARLQTWDAGLEQLADEFQNGQAANVSQFVSDLRYCDIGHILRLHEESSDE